MPGPPKRPLREKVLSRVPWRPDVQCWEWQGYVNEFGYGQITIAAGVTRKAHRLVYELLVGPIPNDLPLDHLCRNRRCVNPAHLEPVTMRENNLRGMGASGTNFRKTACPHGHAYTAQNTVREADGSRKCRTCRNNYQRERRRGRKAA